MTQGQRILSPEAAFLTLEMLSHVPRPEMNYADDNYSAPVFWKTGTSHRFRDAWSIAVFDHYVLGVWIGNFNGRANPEFVGRTAAAPLLFQIIDGLRASWPEPSEPHLPPPGANLNESNFARSQVNCRARSVGKTWKVGLSPEFRRSRLAMCIARCLSTLPAAFGFQSTMARAN